MATKIVDLGLVVGPKGDPGERGIQGPKGDQGEKGNPGQDGVPGKSAYQYAVEGGFTGTEEEFKALMANAATEEYVNTAILLATATSADKLVCIVVFNDAGYEARSIYVKLAAGQDVSDYKLSYRGTVNQGGAKKIMLYPPAGYAFTGISGTYCPDLVVGENAYKGTLDADGVYTFNFPAAAAGTTFSFAANRADAGASPEYAFALVTLEVA